MNPNTIVGARYGILVIIGFTGKGKNRRADCVCDCGNNSSPLVGNIQGGKSRSCGCRKGHSTHRLTNHPLMKTWRMMHERCRNSKINGYELYGGRGITVCKRWNSLEAFISDMGTRPDGTTLDRIDVNGNYEPGNCRWSTLSEQAKNKRDSVIIDHDGISETLAGWARIFGYTSGALYNWMHKYKKTHAETVDRFSTVRKQLKPRVKRLPKRWNP